MKSSVSAVVICKNAERNIARCIRSLQCISDDIIIVDSGSTDNTVGIARHLDARVYFHAWQGYSRQKNTANGYALYDFIFSLDSDEELSPQLIRNINKEMENPQFDAYEVSFLTWYGNKVIHHGAWKNNKLVRLFKKSEICWNDSLVHEKLILNHKQVKCLSGPVYHYTAPSKCYYREKMNRYATEFAMDKCGMNKSAPAWKKYVSTLFRFTKEYLFKLGFLDGGVGLTIALEEARYTYLKYKLSEKNKQKTDILPVKEFG